LEVEGLKTIFNTDDGIVRAVDGVDFVVHHGEILGIVGESGCGKSVTALSIMGLIRPPGRVVEGEIRLNDRNLLTMPADSMRGIRGRHISMIFQQPQSSLNPVMTIGDQLAEVFSIHTSLDRKTRWSKSVELLDLVGIPDPARKARSYPHEMSGGQAQRVMIAMALALKPELLIADEPTTALDVTIQAQILDLICSLRAELGTAIILITHDLGVIAEMVDRVIVMYAGQFVEQAGCSRLFNHSLHPYTQGLIHSIPILGERKKRLEIIQGVVPNLVNLPPGCRFAPRCRVREQQHLTICWKEEPVFMKAGGEHLVRCFHAQGKVGEEEHHG